VASYHRESAYVKLGRTIRKYFRLRRHSRQRPAFSRVKDELRARTKAFSASTTLETQTATFTRLFHSIWTGSSERAFNVRLLCWIRMLEHDDLLRLDFQEALQSMLSQLDSVALLAEAGLPRHHAVFSEGVRRLFNRLLPSAMAVTDSSRLMISLFAHSRHVERFLELPQSLFERLSLIVAPPPTGGGPRSSPRLQSDLRQALCLIATRIGGRGVTAAVRERGGRAEVQNSPFYHLIFATQELVAAPDAMAAAPRYEVWKTAISSCRKELGQVRLRMETTGVSADLVLDLRSIELALMRMHGLARILTFGTMPVAGITHSLAPARNLLNQLIEGRLEDKRVSALLKQNLNLLARKTVERTGRSGEHYIAHTRREYWQMWLAALGGGLLTVLTAAFKMRIVEQGYPLFVEGFFTGTNYAVSFILLQMFGLVLATKQPSATAATFAGIVRNNPGNASWSKISDFTARISRTQLAAAIGNVIAVCIGSVALERLWRVMFAEHYLPVESARHVYVALHPFASGTIIYAAGTGVILWLAALIGGWCENFAVFHRLTEAVSQHPFGVRIGHNRMTRLAGWIELNLAGWSTSIALGYLLGFVPVIARFFGIPFDVRHVTLSTGTLALAAARFGTSSFGHDWFYYAMAGIGVTFVLNLGVSFAIASFVALRAYDVHAREQFLLLRYLLRQIVRSPLKFVFPVEREAAPVSVLTVIPEEK
jgi:site-specific recombinase